MTEDHVFKITIAIEIKHVSRENVKKMEVKVEKKKQKRTILMTMKIVEKTKTFKISTKVKIVMGKSVGNTRNASANMDINHVNAWLGIQERLRFALHNVVKITIATEIKYVFLANAKKNQMISKMGEMTTKTTKMKHIATAKSVDNLPNVFNATDINHVNAWLGIPERLPYALHNVARIPIATEIKHASLENVKILVQVHVDSTPNAQLQIICLVASVKKVTKAIHMNNAAVTFLQKYLKTKPTKMTRSLVPNAVSMPNVKSEKKVPQLVVNAWTDT